MLRGGIKRFGSKHVHTHKEELNKSEVEGTASGVTEPPKPMKMTKNLSHLM